MTEQTPLLLGAQRSCNEEAGSSQGQRQQQAGSHWLAGDQDDDVISLSTKRLVYLTILVISLWTVSYILVMLQIIEEHGEPGRRLSPADWPLFLPMWAGSLIGLVVASYISHKACHNVTLASRERRLMACLPSAPPRHIDFDSLPLMRRLIAWVIALVSALLTALLAQVLYYVWFVQALLGVWHAALPALLLLTAHMLYMYCMSMFSLWACCTYTGLVLATVLFTLKQTHPRWPWAAVCAPFLLTMASLLAHHGKAAADSMRGRLLLSPMQRLCLAAYIVSSALASAAALSTALHPLQPHPQPQGQGETTAYLLWLIAVPLFLCAAMAVLAVEGSRIARSRGFVQPHPLVRSAEGWQASPWGREVSIWLLGAARSKEFTLPPQMPTEDKRTPLPVHHIHEHQHHQEHHQEIELTSTSGK